MTFPRRPPVREGLRAGRIVNGPVEIPERFRARTRPQARTRADGATWFKVANTAESADVYLFDEIGYYGCSAQDLVDQLKAITAPLLRVHINSPGGDAWDGLAIYSCLKAHPARVHVIIHGLAASAASFIAQSGDKITIGRNAMMMIHDASGLCWGNAADMNQMATLLDQLSSNLADIYSQRAGGSVEQWREAMVKESWYTGAEAVAAGLADEMTDPDEPAEGEPSEMRNAWDLSVFRYAGRDAAPSPAPVDRGPASRGEPAPVDRAATGGIVTAPEVPVVGESVPELLVYAHDAHCNVVHTAGPDPCPPPVAPDDADPLGLTPDQRATSDLAAALPDAFVPITDATAPEPDGWAPLVAAMRDPDPWADLTRHLTSADGWAASVAHLTEGAHP